jgi:hypothetical protein
MRKNKRWRVILIGAFVVALVVTSVFALRVSRRVTDFRRGDGAPQIVPWMNIPHVARAHRVPPEILYQALDLPSNETRPLAVIARSQDLDVALLINQLRHTIDEFHLNRAPSPPDAPRPPNPLERGL